MHRGVLESNLKIQTCSLRARHLWNKFNTLTYFIKETQGCHLHGEEKSKIFRKKHANNNRSEIKAAYLPSDWGGIVKWEFHWILIVFSCGPDGGTLWGELMEFANSSRSFCLDTRYLTFKANFLRPQFVQRSCFGVLWRQKKKLDPFQWQPSLRFTVAYQRWPIKVNMQEVAVWPFCWSLRLIIALCAPATALGQHLGINQNSCMVKHYEAKSHIICPTQSPKSFPVYLIIPFSFLLYSGKILGLKRCEILQSKFSQLFFFQIVHINQGTI